MGAAVLKMSRQPNQKIYGFSSVGAYAAFNRRGGLE
jgi:hypothetical protein